MRWIAYRNAKVERIACAWLIRRFVDPDAEFVFVGRETDPARITDGIPFHMPGVELGRQNGRCTFESILAKYELSDPALHLLGRMVHGADIAQDLPQAPPEAYGVRAMALGFAELHGEDDHRKIELASHAYDALYAWCRRQVQAGSG